MNLERRAMTHPPKFLFVEINQRCNLRCKHCSYWIRNEVDRERFMAREERLAIIGDFARLNPEGIVVTCGGEQMLDAEEYFSVSSVSRALGLQCYSVVNGTCIQDIETADRMVFDGPTEITISLNSHLSEIHDESRGTPGSFVQAVNALRLLLDARSRHQLNIPIYAMAVLSEDNYRDLEDFYDFVLNDIGADKLKLNFLQPTFGGALSHSGGDRYFADHVIKDVRKLKEIIWRCDRRFGLQINRRWLRHVSMYLRSTSLRCDSIRGWRGRGTWYPICNSYDRNIMLDVYGTARLCFAETFESQEIRTRNDLVSFWSNRRKNRRRMLSCTRYCGISHSVRLEAATRLRQSAYRRPAHWPIIAFYAIGRRIVLLAGDFLRRSLVRFRKSLRTL